MIVSINFHFFKFHSFHPCSSDQVSHIRHHNTRGEKSKSSQSSLFTRLRRGQLGASRSKVSGDMRHTLGPSDPPQHEDYPSSAGGEAQLDEDIQTHGSQSCPSSPTVNRRLVLMLYYNVPSPQKRIHLNGFLGDNQKSGKMFSEENPQDKYATFWLQLQINS